MCADHNIMCKCYISGMWWLDPLTSGCPLEYRGDGAYTYSHCAQAYCKRTEEAKRMLYDDSVEEILSNTDLE
jgi:hypothetical protein